MSHSEIFTIMNHREYPVDAGKGLTDSGQENIFHIQNMISERNSA